LGRDRDNDQEGVRAWLESLARRFKYETLLDTVEEARESGRDIVRLDSHGDALEDPMGDGRGVMSAMAASCGDDSTDGGDRESAFDMDPNLTARKLGVRCNRLVADRLWRRKASASAFGMAAGQFVRSQSEDNDGISSSAGNIDAVNGTGSRSGLELLPRSIIESGGEIAPPADWTPPGGPPDAALGPLDSVAVRDSGPAPSRRSSEITMDEPRAVQPDGR
jgi:hypothetical protein